MFSLSRRRRCWKKCAKEELLRIARYQSKENAKLYAGKLARIYGPDVRFDVICLPDPFFDDPVWYVLGSGTVAGKSFAEYAASPHEGKRTKQYARTGNSCAGHGGED